MPLPFLKHSQEAAGSSPVETITRAPDEVSYDTLDAIAEDIFHAKDVASVKAALQSLVEHIQSLDSEQDATT